MSDHATDNNVGHALAAKRYWDRGGTRHPARYSSTASTAIDEAFFVTGERDLNHLFETFGIPLSPEATVIEIGSGAGRMTRAFAERVSKVIAADISSSMLDRARESLAGFDNVEFVELPGDGTLPLDSGTADIVFSFGTMPHVSDVEQQYRYLAEASRVVTPFGYVVIQFRQESFRARAVETLAGLRNLARGIPSLSRPWRGSVPLGDHLVSARPRRGLMSMMKLDRRYLWVVIQGFGPEEEL